MQGKALYLRRLMCCFILLFIIIWRFNSREKYLMIPVARKEFPDANSAAGYPEERNAQVNPRALRERMELSSHFRGRLISLFSREVKCYHV